MIVVKRFLRKWSDFFIAIGFVLFFGGFTLEGAFHAFAGMLLTAGVVLSILGCVLLGYKAARSKYASIAGTVSTLLLTLAMGVGAFFMYGAFVGAAATTPDALFGVGVSKGWAFASRLPMLYSLAVVFAGSLLMAFSLTVVAVGNEAPTRSVGTPNDPGHVS